MAEARIDPRLTPSRHPGTEHDMNAYRERIRQTRAPDHAAVLENLPY